MLWSVFRKVFSRDIASFGLQGVHPIFPWFYSKQRFYLCLAKLRCSRILLLRTTFSSSFVRTLHIWRSVLPGKCFGLLASKLGCFEPHVTKNSVFSLLGLKYVAFSFIAGRTCFGFFVVTVGSSQGNCSGKRFSPSLLRFWPFILPKPSFGLVATKLEASSFMSQKAAM